MGRVELRKGFLATRLHISVAITRSFVTSFMRVGHLFHDADTLHFILNVSVLFLL